MRQAVGKSLEELSTGVSRSGLGQDGNRRILRFVLIIAVLDKAAPMIACRGEERRSYPMARQIYRRLNLVAGWAIEGPDVDAQYGVLHRTGRCRSLGRWIVRRFIKALSVLVGVTAVVGLVLRASGVKQRFMDRQFPEGELKPTGWLASLTGATAPWLGRWLYALFAKRLDLQPDDEVLDVACGSGAFLRIYGSRVRKIAGIDHSEDLIEIAKRQNRERVSAGRAEFVVGDATELPWDDNEFTVVTSNCIDCFADKAKPALAEMYRVLRPGGRALVADDHRADMESVGFSRVSVEHIGWGDLTSGYKEAA